MSIIPVSRLSQEELSLLSNNIVQKVQRKRSQGGQQARRQMLMAVNRSLTSVVGESVTTLHRLLLAAS